MTLSSNNSTTLANDINMFETVMPHRYELDDTWYVGLAELAYTKSWFNVASDCKVMLVDENNKNYPTLEVVKKGFYADEHAMEQVLNNILTGFEGDIVSPPYIKFDTVNRRVRAEPGSLNDGTKLYAWLSYDMTEMLGMVFHGPYETETLDENGVLRQNTINAGLTSIRSYDLTAGIHAVYVYCDLIEPVFVGDNYTKCVRSVTVNVEEKFGKDCEKIFNPIQYHKLGKNSFQSILISLHDDAGLEIPFQFGRTRVVLHFKRDGEWMGGEVLP